MNVCLCYLPTSLYEIIQCILFMNKTNVPSFQSSELSPRIKTIDFPYPVSGFVSKTIDMVVSK